MPSKETPSGSCEKTGRGEWTALRERVIGAFRKEICKHCKGGVPFSDERELAHTKTGRAERPNTPCNAWYEVSVLNRVLAEALAAAAPAPPAALNVEELRALISGSFWVSSENITWLTEQLNKLLELKRKDVSPPPQDGQGYELLGPPSKAEREVATATDGPSVRARLQAIYDSHPYEHETTIEGYVRLQNQVGSVLESLDTPSDGQRSDLADSAERSAGYNECLYCGEPVQAPALYCCEEHEEGRRME